MRKKLIPLISLMSLVCVFPQSASATVIENDAVIRPGPFGQIQSLQLTESTREFGVFLIDIENVISSQYVSRYSGILEFYKLFMVSSGTRFDPAFVLQNDSNRIE